MFSTQSSLESGLSSSSPNRAAILHYWSDMTLVKVKYSRRSQVLSGAVQGIEHFCSIFTSGLLSFPRTHDSSQILKKNLWRGIIVYTLKAMAFKKKSDVY